MPANGQSQTPAIRTFQFENGGGSSLKKSVNLFRGDINLNQQILSLPGRPGKHGLDVHLSLMYQSNIHEAATRWNVDHATGIVGLGWDLAKEGIVREDNGSPSPITATYFYLGNGGRNQLVQEPDTPFLFTMSGASFTDDQPIGTANQKLFGQAGILIHETAIASKAGTDWHIADSNQQRLYKLVSDGADYKVYEGGISFQLQNYKFWNILYYPIFERWLITEEDGRKKSFGGIVGATPGASFNNSIAWAVRWGSSKDGAEVAQWVGQSATTNGQQQYASAWYLTKAEDIWGDAIYYAYNERQVSATQKEESPYDTGIQAADIEQKVGHKNGKSYTKAVYLTHIQDVYGRRAILRYGDKIYDNSAADAPREYLDPHKTEPNNDPNPYQDQYETKFLEDISVIDTQGDLLFTLDFEYKPSPTASGRNQEVANVTDNSGAMKGMTFKRFLTGITKKSALGMSLPGIKFDYYFKSDANNPGAIKQVTHPEGAVAQYTFTNQDLDICERRLEIDPPKAVVPNGQTAIPYIWFGKDYAVSLWYNSVSNLLSMRVYTWLGRWAGWQYTDNTILAKPDGGIDPASFEVIAKQNFFGLYFKSDNKKGNLYIFQKDLARPGLWSPMNLDGQQKDPITFDLSQSRLTFTGGDSFLGVLLQHTVDNTHQLKTYTYDWRSRAWTSWCLQGKDWILCKDCSGSDCTINSANVYLGVGPEYLLTNIFTNDGNGKTANLSLFYLDQFGQWHFGSQQSIPGINLSDLDGAIAMDSGASIVAMTAKFNASGTLETDCYIARWDARYQFIDQPFHQQFKDWVPEGGQFPSVKPSINGNSLVGVAGHLIRFNGEQWIVNENLAITDLKYNSIQHYAYAENLGVQGVFQGIGTPTANIQIYDPAKDGTDWQSAVQKLPVNNPDNTVQRQRSNFPSTGGEDYFSIGQYIYSRYTEAGSKYWQPDWASSLKNPPSPLDKTLSSETIINAAPDFVCYLVQDLTDSNKYVGVQPFTFKNGQLVKHPILKGEKYYTNAELKNISYPEEGVGPSGESSFVTYPEDAPYFEKATKLFLYRFAGDAFSGKINHRAVETLSVGDGYGLQHANFYKFDPTTATCDPSGKVVKYYNSQVYAGASTEKEAQSGYISHQYFNGFKLGESVVTYSPDQNANQERYDMLDGMLIKEQFFAQGQSSPVSEKTKEWQVYTQRNRHPLTKNKQALFGGFVRQVQQTHVLDGVKSVQKSNYLPSGLDYPYSGQVVSHTKSGYNGCGKTETHTKYKSYAYEFTDVYPLLSTLHILTAVVQTKTLIQQDGHAAVVTEATATVFKNYIKSRANTDLSIPASVDNFLYEGPGPFTDFPTSTYQTGKVPRGWLLHSSVVAKTDLGLTAETRDAGGYAHSLLYDAHEQFIVASFSNASLQDQACLYTGFEPYEDTKYWSTTGSAKVIADNANTGAGSLELPAAGAGTLALKLQIPLRKDAQTYTLGYWLKTPANFSTEKKSGWTVQLAQDKVELAAATDHPFSVTDGEWVYATFPITVPAGKGVAKLTATASNNTADAIWLDDIHINPLVCQFTAQVYDPAMKYITAAHHGGGKIKRNLRDQFHRIVLQTAPGQLEAQQVKAVIQSYLSRQGNSESRFEPNLPNARLTVHPSKSGRFANFRSGTTWQKVWSANDFANNWQQEKGTLVSKAGQQATLGLHTATPDNAWAVFFELIPAASAQATFGFEFGSQQKIVWDTSQRTFQFTKDGKEVSAPLATPPSPPTNWMLIQSQQLLQFYGDGNLIFSLPSTPQNGQAIKFVCGGNKIVFRQLAYLENPKVSIDYHDALDKPRQMQNLVGKDAWVSQTIYDEQGRAVVQTKTAPASFGSGAGKPIMQYRDGFVKDLTTFITTELAGKGVLQGDVADYYKGKQVGDFKPSDDAGYPYYRKRFEPSPLGRLIEKGQAGKELAIISPHETQPSSRPTFQYSYTKNDATTPGAAESLPAGQFHLDQETAPMKNNSVQIHDVFHRMVSSIQIGTDQATKLHTKYIYTHNETGRKTQKLLPNHSGAPPQQGADQFIIEHQQNLLQHLISQTTPDTGTSLYMYDKQGRLRFKKPNQEDASDAPFIIYYKYDAIGRKIEKGISQFAWNTSTAAKLQSYADDPDWPTEGSTPAFTPMRKIAYDGDGHTASEIGLPVKITTLNERVKGVKIKVIEQYSYYLNGEVKDVTTEISGDSRQAQSIHYEYDNSNNITLIHLPKGKLSKLQYSYDELGNLAGIGVPEHPTVFATYQYDPEMKISKAVLNNGALAGMYQHFPPGWLDNFVYRPTGEEGFSTEAHYAYQYDHNQVIKTINSEINDQQMTSPYNAEVQYDALLRFKQTMVDSDADLNSEVKQYDDNGNIFQLHRGSHDLQMIYQKGRDQPTSVSLAGAAAQSIVFDAQGRLQQAPQLGTTRTNHFRYDDSMGLTAGISVIDGTQTSELTFAYGNKGKRVLKTLRHEGSNQLDRLYLHGIGSKPLLEVDASGTVTTYIYGQGRLVAFVRDKHYTVIQDKSGSVRAVLDGQTGTIEAAYTYYAFGGLKAAGPQPDVLTYLYTGQEFDPVAGLYNYHARLYDPWLGRFYTPDPAQQYASPYVYTGNDPINSTDPSGMFSFEQLFAGYRGGLWAGAGEILLGGLLMATGVGTFSGAALIALGATGVAYSANHRRHFSWKEYGESEAGAAIGTAEVAAGITVTVLTDGALGSNVGATLIGAGMSGISYSAFHKGKFSWSDYAKQELIGAAGGFVTGGVGAIGSGIAAAADVGATAATTINAVSGVVGGVASTYATKAVKLALYHQSWHFSWWTLLSAGESAALGGIGGGLGGYFKSKLPGAPEGENLNEGIFIEDDMMFQPQEGDISSARKFFLGKEGKWFPANNAKRIAALSKPAAFNLKKFHPTSPDDRKRFTNPLPPPAQ